MNLTPKQEEAIEVLGGDAKHCLLEGGSRSGKTFTALMLVAARAIAAPKSRHAVLRFRFNAVKASVVFDTWPKMMELVFPGVPWTLNKTDWFATVEGSEVWFGGLDDKERTEKILGQEFATLFLNEASQIPWSSRNTAITRLAQLTNTRGGKPLRLKCYYDCNPPSQAHWLYKVFRKGVDPETGKPLAKDYAWLSMNPRDNLPNIAPDYLQTLEGLPAKQRARFLDGKYADVTEGALWSLDGIDKWRSAPEYGLPDMQRVIVAIDPSGSGDEDNAGNDEIGIVVAGLGMDGNGYVLEDLTCKTGPKGWGNVATTAFDRHQADLIVAESNFGGDMVRFVVRAAKAGVPFKKVTASRGKAVRAEPIASLTEQGKVRFAGSFPKLEDELCGFTVNGYTGENSPNRADAFVWAMSELFPGMVNQKPAALPQQRPRGIGIG